MAVVPLEQETIKETGARLCRMVEGGRFLMSDLVDTIVRRALASRASDIHIEPTRNGVRVRLRIDGLFQDVCYLPITIHEQLVARVKVLADLASHKRGLTQEGRIVLERDQPVDLRVSVVPTVRGEKVVLRTFNTTPGLFDVRRLGYGPAMTDRLLDMLYGLQGMIVLCGPSGSGKTTTLYASVLEIYHKLDQYASIVSIEDPVEYEFGLFAQIQVNREKGMDFAHGLSAVLRQDPEVIMVGEIRDTETARVALRAGLTGHLVLTTVHSGSAPEVITRILNMGIEPFVVASALTGIISQRLVRRICSDCAAPYTPEEGVRLVAERLMPDPIEFRKGLGCVSCSKTGFSGRIPIAEMLQADEELRTLILERPATSRLRRYQREKGEPSMLRDGIEKVRRGLTTIEEVLRYMNPEEKLE